MLKTISQSFFLTRNLIISHKSQVNKSYISYKKQGKIKANSQQIFQLIKNTQKYSQFIPWCSKSIITRKVSPTQNYTELTIKFNQVKQLSYLSHVEIDENYTQAKLNKTNNKPIFRVKSTCRNSPLKHLISIWEIEKQHQYTTQVNYFVDYQFSSPLLQLTSRFFLGFVGEAMWDIFKKQIQRKSVKAQNIHQQNHCNGSNITFNRKEDINHNQLHQTKHCQGNQQNEKVQQALKLNKLKQDNALLFNFLQNNKEYLQLYLKNQRIEQQIEILSKEYENTKHYEQKMNFQLKNYLIMKGMR